MTRSSSLQNIPFSLPGRDVRPMGEMCDLLTILMLQLVEVFAGGELWLATKSKPKGATVNGEVMRKPRGKRNFLLVG